MHRTTPEEKERLRKLLPIVRKKHHVQYVDLIHDLALQASPSKIAKWLSQKGKIDDSDIAKLVSYLKENGYWDGPLMRQILGKTPHALYLTMLNQLEIDVFSKDYQSTCNLLAGVYEYFRLSITFPNKIIRGMMSIEISYIEDDFPVLTFSDIQRAGGAIERHIGYVFVHPSSKVAHIIYRDSEDCRDLRMSILHIVAKGEDNHARYLYGKILANPTTTVLSKETPLCRAIFARRWSGDCEALRNGLGILSFGDLVKDFDEDGMIRNYLGLEPQ